ncbi:unnamed protein product, partial [Staurois parvus]
MQVIQRYHSPPEVKDAAFSLSVQPQCLEDGKLAILLEFWYTGSRSGEYQHGASGGVQSLSGFVSLPESIEEIKKDSDVKRVEVK